MAARATSRRAGARSCHLALSLVAGTIALKRHEKRPPLPWGCREHGSERPTCPGSYAPVLNSPAGGAELPHTANAAGSGGASNRPQHARSLVTRQRLLPRRRPAGRCCVHGLHGQLCPAAFHRSRPLRPMLPPSARELWAFLARFADQVAFGCHRDRPSRMPQMLGTLGPKHPTGL